MATVDELLWQQSDSAVFAVLDGAAIPDLLDQLFVDGGPDFDCLFMGELEPDMQAVAPYLVKLSLNSPFYQWLMSGWGQHWGILLQVPVDMSLPELRRHLRKFNTVYDTAGQSFSFRYYDPRVLLRVLPILEPRQLSLFFGAIQQLVLETSPQAAKAFTLEAERLIGVELSKKG